MAGFIFTRFLVGILRLAGGAVFLVLLIEGSHAVLGGSDRHVWEAASWAPPPPEFSGRQAGWGAVVAERTAASGRVVLLALPALWFFGYAWGLLGARLRRLRGARWLSAPFSLLACAPGVWVVVLAAVYSYLRWQRPGFANDLVVDRGPDLLAWWHAAVVAVPAAAGLVAWQIRAVSAALEREAARPWVKGLFVGGASDEEIFYGHVLRHARSSLLDLLDRSFPALLGALVCLESAFRYPGIGALLVDSVKYGSYGGILASAFVLMSGSAALTFARESLAGLRPSPHHR